MKGYFFRATQSTQLVYVNQQACEKGYALYKQLKQIVFQRLIYHRLKYLNRQTCDKKVIVVTKVSNKLVSKRVLFHSLIHKKGVSRSKDHSEKVGFQRFADAHADPAHPPPRILWTHREPTRLENSRLGLIKSVHVPLGQLYCVFFLFIYTIFKDEYTLSCNKQSTL